MLTGGADKSIILTDMAASTRKPPASRATAQKLAARRAEEAARVLHSLAATLNSLDESTRAVHTATPTPRNWWKVQAGRFGDDPTFADFVAEVKAARKRGAKEPEG